METQYNFEEIWKKKKADVPDASEIKSKANKFRRKQLLSSLYNTLCLLISLGTVTWVWFSFPNLHFLTKSGMVLMLAALVIFIFQNFQKIRIINKINPSLSNQEYLKQMKMLQQKDLYLQTKGISVYYLLLSLGIAFYLFEFTQRMTLFWGIFTYSVTFGWILFGWIFIRPRKIRKEQKKISEVIQSLEKMEEDFLE